MSEAGTYYLHLDVITTLALGLDLSVLRELPSDDHPLPLSLSLPVWPSLCSSFHFLKARLTSLLTLVAEPTSQPAPKKQKQQVYDVEESEEDEGRLQSQYV